MTALAAAFMSSRARLSLGFSNAYLSANLLSHKQRKARVRSSLREVLLCEATTINPYHDPRVGKEYIRLFEVPNVFESLVSQLAHVPRFPIENQ